MPTNQNAYNSRVTDETLEKKFRDTFTSQGGAELVSDLYASGVIVPVVDFTSAAEGSALRQDLQSSWDFATGFNRITGTTTTVVNTPGFWKVDLNFALIVSAAVSRGASVQISDGIGNKKIWNILEMCWGCPGAHCKRKSNVAWQSRNWTMSPTTAPHPIPAA